MANFQVLNNISELTCFKVKIFFDFYTTRKEL